MSWACLLKRVFDIDIEYCPNCGGRLKIIAAIVDPAVIAKILTYALCASTPTLGLDGRAEGGVERAYRLVAPRIRSTWI